MTSILKQAKQEIKMEPQATGMYEYTVYPVTMLLDVSPVVVEQAIACRTRGLEA